MFSLCEKCFNDCPKNDFALSVNVNNNSSKGCGALVGLDWIKTIMNFWKASLDNAFWKAKGK